MLQFVRIILEKYFCIFIAYFVEHYAKVKVNSFSLLLKEIY
jgi:hypothetical protein